MSSDAFSGVGRAPNVDGSKTTDVQSEEDALLEELAYSPGFKLFLQHIVLPIVMDIRAQLLRSVDVSEVKRANLVGQLDTLERVFDALYRRTSEGGLPEAIANFFR